MRLTAGVALAVASALGASSAPRAAAARTNRGGAAVGGAVAGLVCGGATLTYARLRAGPEGPLLWHDGGPGWIGVYFLEHAAVGGGVGAIGRAPRQGFVLGGIVACGLDLAWVISSEVLAATEEPTMALVELGPGGARWRVPPVIVRRRGAWAPLFAWRF